MSVLKEFVEAATRRSYAGTIPDETITKGPGGSLIVKGLDSEEIDKFNEKLTEGGFKKGLNLGKIGEVFDDKNFFDLDLETVLSNIKEKNKDLFEHFRRNTKSMDEMVSLAELTGIENIVYKMMKRKPGDPAKPEEVVGGIIAVVKMAQEMRYGAMVARMNPNRAEKEEAFKKIGVLAGISQNLAAQVSGAVSEAMRTGAAVRNIQYTMGFDISSYVQQMDSLVDDLSPDLMDYHLSSLALLPNPAARAKYAEKGFLSKSWDLAMENYINALLSGTVTHMVNIAGNGMFQGMTLLERGLAGAIGNIRTLGGLRGEVGDQRYMSEALAEAHGLMMAQKDALTLMGNTMVTGRSNDLVSKIDLREQRALGSTDSIIDIKNQLVDGHYFQSFIDSVGIATRMSGRFLASEDEYFKVITRRRVQYREAFRAQMIAYQTEMRVSGVKELAKERGEEAYVSVMTNPSARIEQMMTDESRKMTFQGAPEGFFGKMAPFIRDVPLLKVIVPFYNTPTNIINEAYDRTLNIYPLYRVLKGDISGPELDDALAKLAMGNGIALSIMAFVSGDFGDNVIITGTGSDYATEQVVKGSGVQPMSIGFKQDNGEYNFYSLSRFDPLSALIIMGADMRDYMKYEDDMTLLGAMGKAYTLTAAEYSTNMPFLQGVSELSSTAANRHQSTEDFFVRMLEFGGKQAGSVVTNVAGNLSKVTNPFGLTAYAYEYLTEDKYPFLLEGQTSMKATMERIQNPVASNTMLPEGIAPLTYSPYTELNGFAKGFYEALQRAKSRNPLYNDELPPRLDFWGNEVTTGDGRFSEAFNPVRLSQGGYSSLDKEVLRLAENGYGSFSLHGRRINKILLNGEQYNTFVKTINDVDDEGLRPGEPGYNPNQTLLNQMSEKVSDVDSYFNLDNGEDQFDELNSILSFKRKKARQWMQANDLTLRELEVQ